MSAAELMWWCTVLAGACLSIAAAGGLWLGVLLARGAS